MPANPKNSPSAPASPSPQPAGGSSVLRFWICFLLSILALGIVSGLLLAGFFRLMGYQIF